MKLNIHNYEILNFPTDSLVISEKGVSRISSPSLLQIVTKLKKYNPITKSELDALIIEHDLNPKNAHDFLYKALNIREVADHAYFEKTIIAHDWSEDNNLENLLKSEIRTTLELCAIQDLSNKVAAEKSYFIVILCKEYNYDILKSIYFELANAAPDSAICVCYNTGDAYCISQPYIPTIGNPCHFCTMDKIINSETYQNSKNTWSRLLNFCRSRHISVPIAPLSLYQRTVVVGAIIQKIRLMTSAGGAYHYQDNILHGTYVSLNDGSTREVSVSHWCLCDCLRADK